MKCDRLLFGYGLLLVVFGAVFVLLNPEAKTALIAGGAMGAVLIALAFGVARAAWLRWVALAVAGVAAFMYGKRAFLLASEGLEGMEYIRFALAAIACLGGAAVALAQLRRR